MPDGFTLNQPAIDTEFVGSVRDAELLLRYAATSGVTLPEGTIAAIVKARECVDRGMLTPETVVAFFAAATELAAKTAPVTTETLRVSDERTRRNLRWNGAGAIALALLVAVFSGISFVTVSMSDEIAHGIKHADELAVKLRTQVGPPFDASETICGAVDKVPRAKPQFGDESLLITELQDFASGIRMLLRTASKLDFFVLSWEQSPLDTTDAKSGWRKDANAMVHLDSGLVNMRREGLCKIGAYQDVRDFGQNVRADTLAFYGAITAYLLPVLYALLGAFAFNLRDFSERVRRRTYHPTSYANMARTIAAMTVGAIISLFNVFSHEASLQPLAVAFLAGYGVEVFFAFLDALLTTFGSKK